MEHSAFFNYIKIKRVNEVHIILREFRNIYSSLYRSVYVWCNDTTLNKIFSIEKFNSG